MAPQLKPALVSVDFDMKMLTETEISTMMTEHTLDLHMPTLTMVSI